MQSINFNEVRQKYFLKNYKSLSNLAAYMSNMHLLNAALLDKDSSKVELYKSKLLGEGAGFEMINVSERIQNGSRLKIVYLMASTGVTGGTRILIEQSNKLAEKGHDVILLSHCPQPDWIECKANFMLVHPDFDLSDLAPKADVVIAGYWTMVPDAMRIHAPVKYHFAQGDFDIFDYHNQQPEMKAAIWAAYALPLKILTNSQIMIDSIEQLFNRKAVKIPNALSDHFLKDTRPKENESNPLRILLVGSDLHEFKGFDSILNVLHYLKVTGCPFQVVWLTQQKLRDYSALSFEIEEHVCPPQDEIVSLYRGCDIYVCGSRYESFCLPALEAMASGAAVVTSDNGGIREYAKDGGNCLIYRPGDELMLARKLEALLTDASLRNSLREQGLATAKTYTWSNSIRKLEQELKKAAEETLQAVHSS